MKEEIIVTFYPNKSQPIVLKCEVAKSITKKMKGLMHRDNLPSDHGMFFIFLIPWIRFFWMKNMKIPLDIIFINRHLKIISISEAPVEKGIFYKNYWSRGLSKYVIECNMGFCKKHNITKSTRIKIKE